MELKREEAERKYEGVENEINQNYEEFTTGVLGAREKVV